MDLVTISLKAVDQAIVDLVGLHNVDQDAVDLMDLVVVDLVNLPITRYWWCGSAFLNIIKAGSSGSRL